MKENHGMETTLMYHLLSKAENKKNFCPSTLIIDPTDLALSISTSFLRKILSPRYRLLNCSSKNAEFNFINNIDSHLNCLVHHTSL